MTARGVFLWLLGCCFALQAFGATVNGSYPLASASGTIEALDFGQSTMIVSGYRYHVATDVTVEIDGSYGAFTMLEPGMPIRFDYLRISPSERRMVLIQELPPDVDPAET